MNFFEHQDRARSSTRLLVALFVCAVAALILVTVLLVVFLSGMVQGSEGRPPLAFDTTLLTSDIFFVVSTVVVAVVGLGTLYRIMQLRGGGKAIAEGLGGRLLNVQTRDADERKVLNVVEEMAIAAGLPVPQVYLLEDPAINAFAAGYHPQDAVIGITRGCIHELDRDELQGVVAHEFSHILNGDMRLNILLIGWLYGIMVIGLVGYHLLRGMRYSGRSNKKGGGLIFLALGLMAVGYGGTFFGNLIKAAVSRQREFLADASAVQYTRNPGGIGNALKKIGGYATGTIINAADTAEISHMLFGPGARFALFATHPPLEERIRRIEPRWKGDFNDRSTQRAEAATQAVSQPVAGFVESVGQLTEAGLSTAQQRLAALPVGLHAEVHSSFGSYLTIFALLMAASEQGSRRAQWQYLAGQLAPAEFAQLQGLYDQVAALDRKLYLPLVDLALPTLRQLSVRQWQTFMQHLQQLAKADANMTLFEWCLFRILRAALTQRSTRGGTVDLDQCIEESRLLLAACAREGQAVEAAATVAFAAGMAELRAGEAGALPAPGNLDALDRAVERLRLLNPLQKPRLLKALVRCIQADRAVTSGEAELLRAIGAALDCPIPPT